MIKALVLIWSWLMFLLLFGGTSFIAFAWSSKLSISQALKQTPPFWQDYFSTSVTATLVTVFFCAVASFGYFMFQLAKYCFSSLK